MTSTIQRGSKSIAAVAAFAAFLATFNETFLNIAFSPIMTDFGLSVSSVQWLATALMLGAAVMVPVSAFAYRSLPTRPLFVATVGLLVIGSLVGALAPSFPILLIGRVIQALGTGLLIPIGMNITLEVAPREKLGTYMGVMGSMTTLGPSSSVMLSGVLLSFFDWRSLLWAFLGLSVACMLCGLFFLPNVAKLTHPRLDVLSVVLIGLALVGLFYGISTIFSGSFLVAGVAFVIGAICLVLFVRRQGRLDQPLINLQPLKVRAFSLGAIVNVIALISMFAMNIVIPMFMQSVLGISSMNASLVLFPAIALSCVLSPVAGRLSDKHGPIWLLITGFVLITVFTCAISVVIPGGSILALALLYMPVIGGSALIIGPIQGFALSKLSHELAPHGVTVMSTGFQIAGCVGASLMTGIYAGVTTSQVVSGIAPTAAASTGFLVAGLVTAVFAIIGIALVIWLRSITQATVESVSTAISPLSQIMKSDVYALEATQSIGVALRLLVEKKISGAPVVGSDGGLVGFLSDGDVMRFLAAQHPAFKNAWSFVAESGNEDFDETLSKLVKLPVAEIATRHVISIDIKTTMSEVCKILADHHLRKAPVVDGGRMVGIVNRSNISRFVLANARPDLS
jgi:DHA2 family lincomycin resistance protein-like MFS transporter